MAMTMFSITVECDRCSTRVPVEETHRTKEDKIWCHECMTDELLIGKHPNPFYQDDEEET
jgi:hypothetical protein